MALRSHYRINRSRLTLALAAALVLPATALAQDAGQAASSSTSPQATSEQADATKTLDQVTVVGSRIKRAQVEGPSPVTIITAEEIEKEGFNTVHEALETISQNTGFSQNDFNANGGFTPNASVVNLRGMGPGRTLLLINGRRVNDYPFPYNGRSNFQNFNSIPASAVQRIEVLAGGASAIYGSDAVAGVVNVVLKTNYSGDEVKVKYQIATDGGRNIADVQWTGGKTKDNWSLTYAFESYNAKPLFAYERDFMDSAQDNPAPPGVNGSTGVGGYQPPIGIQIRRMNGTGSTTQAYVLPAGQNCNASSLYRPWTYTSSVSGATLGPGCGYDRFPAEQTIANGNRDLSAYLYGTWDFDNDIQAWASLSAYKSRGRLSGGVEQWQGGPQPGTHFYDPVLGFRAFPIRAITPESYGGSEGTFQKFDERSYDFAVGLRGTIADRWDWDFTLGGAKYHAIRDRPRLTVAGATAYFMGPRLGTVGQGAYAGVPSSVAAAGTAVYQLNLAHFYGQISAADYAAMSTLVHYDGKSDNASAQFTISGDLFDLPAGPVGFAGVLEATKQSYDLVSDRRIFPDVREIYNLTGTGGGGERNRYAIGGEFKVPIFSQLTLSLAGRFDKYDDITDVDDAKTWGAGLEYRPFSNLLVRANYATSFKAPDMHYVFSERSGSFGTVTDYVRCYNAAPSIPSTTCGSAGGTYNYSVFTTSQGQPGLSEETGKSWSAGFVWDATDNLSFSLDYYRIDLKNVVTVQSGTSILGDEYGCLTGTYPNGTQFPFESGSEYCANIANRISRDSNGVLTEIRSGPINLAFQGTKGIDGSVKYTWDAGNLGNFRAQATWSSVLEQTDRATPSAALRSYRDANSNPDFRSRARLTLGWNRDKWDATALMLRTGSFAIWQPLAANTLGLGARTGPLIQWNTSVGYQFNNNLSFRVNVNNVFNKIAPEDPTFNSYPYFYSAYSAIGRTIGIEAAYKFND